MNIVREIVAADRARNAETARPMPLANLFAALAKAQGEFPVIPKAKAGHGYNYAPLDLIQRLTRPVLSKHGLGFSQYPDGDEMVTLLFHASGECKEFRYPMKRIGGARMNEMQAQGAVTTYAARYSYCLALGISADEDTDAHEHGAVPTVTEDFRDMQHDGMNTGVKGVAYPPNATPAEKARLSADGIIKTLREAKTPKGLDGVWSRNERLIDRLRDSYPADFANVLDAYETIQTGMREAVE